MHFVRRVRTVWPWLPAFRAVAETQHLPTAAQELEVVPSALSRTVKLLEDELGVSLFDRTAKTLVLNEAGRRLLAATRDAMRILDEALASAAGDEMRGTVTAVACHDIAHAVLPRACAVVADRHRDICAAMTTADDAEIAAVLLRGDADVALVLQPPDSPDLVVAEVATWTRGVYARAGSTVNTSFVRCVGVGTPAKHADDGWPPTMERELAAWACDHLSALDLVARSGFVTVAFDAVAKTSHVFEQIIRLPKPAIEPRSIYLVHRRAVHRHRRTEALVEAINDSLRQLAVE